MFVKVEKNEDRIKKKNRRKTKSENEKRVINKKRESRFNVTSTGSGEV